MVTLRLAQVCSDAYKLTENPWNDTEEDRNGDGTQEISGTPNTSLPSDWNHRRKRVYSRDDYECQNCGTVGGPRGDSELHAHHVVPRKNGGSDGLNNLTTLCKDCHEAAHGWRSV